MARPRTTHSLSLNFVEDLIRRHFELARQIRRLQIEQRKVDDQLRVALEVAPDKFFDTESGEAQLVAEDVVTFDLDVLRDALSPEMLERITRRELDPERLERAASQSAIPEDVVERARRVHARKWRLKVRPH